MGAGPTERDFDLIEVALDSAISAVRYDQDLAREYAHARTALRRKRRGRLRLVALTDAQVDALVSACAYADTMAEDERADHDRGAWSSSQRARDAAVRELIRGRRV